MNPNEYDLSEAASIYSVANTPNFLLRKLQGNAAVRTIADTRRSDEIVDAIHATALIEPTSAVDAVWPYVLLVALWFKSEIEPLRQAATINAPNHQWYAYLATVLISTFSPIQKQVIEVPTPFVTPKIPEMSSNAPIDTRIIIIR